ncbi:MAG: lysostaphin resistance A-like protein [Candidatus Njordarchaeales archaeon]
MMRMDENKEEATVKLILFYFLLLLISSLAGTAYSAKIIPMDLIYVSLIIYVLIFNRVLDGDTIISLGILRENALPYFILGFLLSASMISLVIFILVIGGIATIHYTGSLEVLELLRYLILFLSIAFAEELIFRAYPLKVLTKSFSPIFSAIITGIIFSLMHSLNIGYNLIALINLFLIGVFLALLFVLTRNIFLVAGFHMGWNLIEGIIFGLPVSGFIYSDTVFTLELSINEVLLSGGSFGIEASLATTTIASIFLALTILNLNKLSKRIK